MLDKALTLSKILGRGDGNVHIALTACADFTLLLAVSCELQSEF